MPAQGGLAAMIAEAGGSKDLVKSAREIEAAPGGAELLYTFAAEEMMKGVGATKKQTKKIRLYNAGGPVKAARGGSTKAAAERTRQAGRGDDSIMLHMSPEEAEVISSMWGPPQVNPNTGIGEYGFLSKVWKKLKKGVKKIVGSKVFQMVAPIMLAVFAPALIPAIGGALGATTPAAAAMVGNAVVQGGLGAIAGGKEGAIRGVFSGVAAGGAGSALGGKLGLEGATADIVGSALLEGAGAELGGGDFTSGAITGGLGAAMRPGQEAFVSGSRQKLGLEGTPITIGEGAGINPVTGEPMGFEAGVGMEPIAAGSTFTPEYTPTTPIAGKARGIAQPAALGPPPVAGVQGVKGPTSPKGTGLGALTDLAMPALLAAGALGGGGGEYEQEVPPWADETFRGDLPTYQMNRSFQGLDPGAYYTYGQAGAQQSGQKLFIDPPDPFAGEEGSGSPLAGGLEAATPTETVAGSQQPVPVRPGRAGQQQRQQLESQGWNYDQNSNTMYPPEPVGFAARGGYQRGGEFDYWEQTEDVFNTIPTVSASGGYTRGPGSGRSDDIEARLSDGEYVIDAESVSLLGDGSGEHGARRLDEMRSNLRKHKSKNLKKGEFSLKAKKPASYMGKMQRLRRKAKYEHGGVSNVAGSGPTRMVAPGSNV